MPLKQIIKFLKETNELTVAATLLDTFSKYSKSNMQFDELAMLYHDIKQYKKSAYFAEKSLILSSNPHEMYAARSNLAKVYNHMNEPSKALKNIKLNLLVNPNDYEQKLEYIFTLYLLGNYKECEEMLLELIKDPDISESVRNRIMFNLGTYDIEKGKFKEGFELFTQYGKKIKIFSEVNPPVPDMKEWRGEDVKEGQKLLIFHTNGGIGDEIINIRFMKKLKEKGFDPVWLSSFPLLKDVFNRNGYKTINNVRELTNIKEYVYCSSMELPYTLGLNREELGRESYITPDPVYVEKWKHVAGGVGIKWSGNKEYEHDLHRTLPLSELAYVVKDLGKQIYSIQKEDFEGIEDYPNIIDLHSELNTIEDALGIIWNLDYIVTSCSSTAHMAGSMGKKVYVLPPISCYYVWLGRQDNKSDWYCDNVTVFRQTEWSSWEIPLNKLKESL